MTTALLDSPESEQRLARWFPDHQFVENRSGPQPRSHPLESRWVPDPRGEQARICIWVPRTVQFGIGPTKR